MNADGSAVEQLTNDGSDNDAAWHPDGSKLAFTRVLRARGGSVGPTLYVIDAEGTAAARVALPTTVTAVTDPAWSPDGAALAFVCEIDSGDRDICVVNADGTGFNRLTSGSGRDVDPAWKPDGSAIAFATTRFSGVHEIAVMNPDGSGVTRVTAGTGAIEPTWSPDGTRIAFSAFACDIHSGCATLGLFVMNADGTGLNQLTSGPDNAPSWRP